MKSFLAKPALQSVVNNGPGLWAICGNKKISNIAIKLIALAIEVHHIKGLFANWLHNTNGDPGKG